MNEIFSEYNSHPNFLTYLVDGGQHCFTNMNVFYQADAKGPKDDGITNEGEMMDDWTFSYPLSDGGMSSTVCEGDYEGTIMATEGPTYCNTSVAPKDYVAPY